MEKRSIKLGNKITDMSSNSEYISRSGKISSGVEDIYYFLSDIRNFERFIPKGEISELKIGQDSAEFHVPMLGNVSVKISEKVMFRKIVFTGNALLINDFSLIANITPRDENQSDVSVTLSIDLNPLFKMAAEKPIAQFLESLISGMENFNDWGNITR
jgi:carbon monoxide dehydrogenase subunit G